MVRERPILFSGAMVRAILDGTKTQTRRMVKLRHPIEFLGGRGDEGDPEEWGYAFDGPDHHGYMVLGQGFNERHNHGRVSIPCPYGAPGDRLWVRETWGVGARPCPLRGFREGLEYRADDHALDERDMLPLHEVTPPDGVDLDSYSGHWVPSIHMPRWASRITLEVTGVRVERLREISGEDARAEGVQVPRCACEVCARTSAICPADQTSYVEEFRALWESINGSRPGCSWAENPWLWVIEFRRVEAETRAA